MKLICLVILALMTTCAISFIYGYGKGLEQPRAPTFSESVHKANQQFMKKVKYHAN